MFYNYIYVHRLGAFFFSCLQFLLPAVFFLTILHFVVSSLSVLTPILSCILVFIKKCSVKITAMLGTVQGPGQTTVREIDGVSLLSSPIPWLWATDMGRRQARQLALQEALRATGEGRSAGQRRGRGGAGCSGLQERSGKALRGGRHRSKA